MRRNWVFFQREHAVDKLNTKTYKYEAEQHLILYQRIKTCGSCGYHKWGRGGGGSRAEWNTTFVKSYNFLLLLPTL